MTKAKLQPGEYVIPLSPLTEADQKFLQMLSNENKEKETDNGIPSTEAT